MTIGSGPLPERCERLYRICRTVVRAVRTRTERRGAGEDGGISRCGWDRTIPVERIWRDDATHTQRNRGAANGGPRATRVLKTKGLIMTTDRIVHDLKVLVRDAEELVEATAHDVTERAKEARVRLRRAVAAAQESCEELQEKAVAGARAADTVIRDHPYQSIGVALGVGVLLGVLAMGRRGG